MTLAWSPCFSAPDLKWEREKHTAWCVHYNTMAMTGKHRDGASVSINPETLPLALSPPISLNSNPSRPRSHCEHHFTSILAPHSLMWSLSSQLPEPYLFTPCGIHHFLSCINYVCTWPICILLTFLKHRHLSTFSPLLPPTPSAWSSDCRRASRYSPRGTC